MFFPILLAVLPMCLVLPPTTQRQEESIGLTTEPGWKWLIPPVAVKEAGWPKHVLTRKAEGVEINLENPERGLLSGRYLTVHVRTPNWSADRGRGTAYAAVILDHNRVPIPESSRTGNAHDGIGVQEYTYDGVEPGRVDWVGLEILTPQGRREAA